MKKIFSVVTVITLLALFFAAASQVLASPENAAAPDKTRTPPGQVKGHGKPVHLRGTITAVDATSLTVEGKDGSSETVVLTEETKIKMPGKGKEATIADLQVGFDVSVQARRNEDETLTARRVMVVPGKPSDSHRVGTVTDFQPGVSITIQDKKGDAFTYLLIAETKILPAERANSLAVGSKVTIIAPRDPAAPTLTARGIVVHPEAGPE